MTARIGARNAASSDEPTGVSSAHKANDAPSGPISGTAHRTHQLHRGLAGRSMIRWGGTILNQRYRVFTEGAAFTPAVR
jgi:hypothetical protein